MITIGGATACSHGNWDVLTPTWRTDLRDWIVQQHDRHGYGWAPLADVLNRERVPPLAGAGAWHASSVQSVYRRPGNPRLGVRA